MRDQRHPLPLYPREREPVPIFREAGWALGPYWTVMENLAHPPGFVSRTVQPVASRYTDWDIFAVTVSVPTCCLEYSRSQLHYVTAYSKLSCLAPFANTRPTQSNSTLAAKLLGYRGRGDMKWGTLVKVRIQWHLAPFLHYKHRITNLELCQAP
jgi:hypothetical protein